MGKGQQKALSRSNSRSVKIDGKTRQDCRWFFPVLLELQRIFETKLPQELAHRAGRSIRVCEKWVAKRGAPDGRAMRNLIDSDVGDIVVLALIKTSNQKWAKQYQRLRESSQLLDQMRDTQRRLDAMKREIFE